MSGELPLPVCPDRLEAARAESGLRQPTLGLWAPAPV